MDREEKEIDIKTGVNFRKGIIFSESGNCHLIQIKDLIKEKIQKRLDTSQLDRIDMKVTDKTWFVESGNILILKKGGDWQAHLIKNVPENTVVGQHFLVLQISPKSEISPEFLSFYLNLPFNQSYLDNRSGGGKQASISKADLEALKVPLLSGSEQRELMGLADSIESEKQVMLKLISNREMQLQKTIEQLLER